MTEYDARMVAADIVRLLHSTWQGMPNERTDKALTSYRQNHCAEGISEAINIIADSYGLDISDRSFPQVKPD